MKNLNKITTNEHMVITTNIVKQLRDSSNLPDYKIDYYYNVLSKNLTSFITINKKVIAAVLSNGLVIKIYN